MLHFAMNNKLLYTTFGYDNFGLPTYRMTGNYYPTSNNIQYLETNFDPATGNLNWRKDSNRNLTEGFFYDQVHKNRLATWQVTGQQLYSATYNNANGNILAKTDFTSAGNPYTYGLDAGPHAVTGVLSPLVMPAEAEQEISYNSFNKASYIRHNYQRRELFLQYGPDEQRVKTELKINGQTTLTRYFPGGGLEVEVDANGQERWLHYLPGGGLYVCDKNFNKIGMYYVLTDYLGSAHKVITETGTTVEEYSFDPWGRRRNPTNWSYTGVPSSFIFSRGYTGHEMLDAFGLVNMNGRMYDPVMGRMLSPDNYVSFPEHTQGYNRYTYALNNPLIITDPSGNNPAIIAMIAYSAIVGGLSSAENGDGFLQGFGVGAATGALSYGVGAAIGPVVSGSTAWANMANAGINTAIAGGITYGTDALVNNTAFNWKAYGLNIATSMAMAGLTYQKPAVQSQSISLVDLEDAGLQSELGSGYGMSSEKPKKRSYYYNPPKNKSKFDFSVNNAQGGGGPGWEVYVGTATSIISEMYYSKTYGTWMGKNFKMYKQTWGGNGVAGGKNKFGKSTSNAIKWGGRIVGAYSGYKTIEQRVNGEIGTGWMFAELGTTGVSTFGGLYGAAWGVGWELGRAVTTLDAYQEFKFNFWYNRMENAIGPPSSINEGMWYDFFNNYGQ
jgi:RHS repeat-associated protein